MGMNSGASIVSRNLVQPGILKLFVMAMLLALILLPPGGFRPAPAHAVEPQLAVSPTAGPPGSTFNVTGSGFFPGSSLGVFFAQLGAETHLGNVGVGPAGGFSGSFQVPSGAAPGDALVTARNSIQAAEATFEVTNGDGDDADDEALCRIKVTLFGVARDDPSNRTARARITSSVNLGIGKSTVNVTLGGVPIILDEDLGEALVPKRLFPRRLQITSIVSSDGHGADHESLRINCPDSKTSVSVVRTFVLAPIPPDGGEPDDRQVDFEVIYRVEVTDVQ
jgi:hypothetical protein